MRTYTLFFYHDQGYTHEILSILAVLTIILGVIGAVAYWDVKRIPPPYQRADQKVPRACLDLFHCGTCPCGDSSAQRLHWKAPDRPGRI
ncbi:Multiple resistance and pH homeostasis protein D [Mycobacteroides abscessus subsp. abscessus]|nr:Multiple resistance and pH homeostasis protein D [Mycobacteroides abscessus subsp. abscessus]